MSAIRIGDIVEWKSPQFSGGSAWGGRFSGAKYIGTENFRGKVVKHSYGAKTGQHTFTIMLDSGGKKLVKGRNLYPNLIDHVVDQNSPDRIGAK